MATKVIDEFPSGGGGGTGNVVADANITDNAIVRGDGGAKKIQDSLIIINDSGDIDGVRNLVFETTGFTPGTNEGTVYFDGTEYTLMVVPGLNDVVLPTNYVLAVIVYNDTGIQINKGSAIHPIAAVTGGVVHVELATAETHVGFENDLWLATMDIPDASIGIATKFGLVRDIDTSALSLGDVWLSPTTPGALTSIRPSFPDYAIKVGGCLNVNATTGIIGVDVRDTKESTFNNFHNGTFREQFDFLVTSDGVTITGTLSPRNGHDDMTMLFSDGFTILDTSPALTVTLTAGTPSVRVTNYVYIPKSTKVLTVSTTEFPVSTEYIPVAIIVLKDAVTTQSDGALRNQNINNEVQTSYSQGYLQVMGETIREGIGARNINGAQGTATIVTASTPDDVYVAVTSGVIRQMHRQVTQALDMQTGTKALIANDETTPFAETTNLNTITTDSEGNSLLGQTFSLVAWIVANSAGEPTQLCINKPIDSYPVNFFNPIENAINDVQGYAVKTIPEDFIGVGSLVARFTFSLNGAGTEWTLEDTEDLRKQIPNVSGGGAAGGTGVTTYLALTDVPSTNIGQATKQPIVNSAETGHQYINYKPSHISFFIENVTTSSECTVTVRIPTGFTARLTEMVARMTETSATATVSVTLDGGAITDLTNVALTDTQSTTDIDPDEAITDKQELTLSVSAVSGTTNLTADIPIEYDII